MNEIKKEVPKLSEFFGNTIIRFNEFGKKEQIVPVPHGDIKLYTLDEILDDGKGHELAELQRKAEAISKNNEGNIAIYSYFIYDLIGLLTNMDMDLTKENFYKSLKKATPCLTDFVQDVFNHFNELKKNIIKYFQQMEKISNSIPKKSKLEMARIEWKRFTELMESEKDSSKKKDIIAKLWKTQEIINKLEKEKTDKKNIEAKAKDRKELKENNNIIEKSKDTKDTKVNEEDELIKELEKAMKNNDKDKINELLDEINKLRDKNK